MHSFLVKFTVNGRTTEQTVNAVQEYVAKQLIQAQYAGQKIVFLSVKRL